MADDLSVHMSVCLQVVDNVNGWLYVSEMYGNRVRRISLGVKSGGIITSILGTTMSGYTGDLGPGTLAELNQPAGLALDNIGNLYVSDSANNVIRVLQGSSGRVVTIAGNRKGAPGYRGDGGGATAAYLFAPTGLAVDKAAGAVYVADRRNHRVRRMDIATILLHPTMSPTFGPPSSQPSSQPSRQPFSSPSRRPSSQPTTQPTSMPTFDTVNYAGTPFYRKYLSALTYSQASIPNGVRFSSFWYKGSAVGLNSGGCQDWTRFTSKALNIPYPYFLSNLTVAYASYNIDAQKYVTPQNVTACTDPTSVARIATALSPIGPTSLDEVGGVKIVGLICI